MKTFQIRNMDEPEERVRWVSALKPVEKLKQLAAAPSLRTVLVRLDFL